MMSNQQHKGLLQKIVFKKRLRVAGIECEPFKQNPSLTLKTFIYQPFIVITLQHR